ncbi:uncharacterized protein LOC112577361 isoform X2 [Pomacea canaliculata]|uniref:uncharacterized protein LOC112577361 isoform X2 n=1 Tax=Pomacea canaliculata TaxID=400727 RepID=UPI000D73451A|nr:uncharacterized protein LOC112577361 isoform X2 [Pomacea canaliculata]
MTTTHQLMAAAFYLCNLLFLYHVDPVNSLICKNCEQTDPNCNSGEVADAECEPSMPYCITIKGTFSDVLTLCPMTCQTDRCNNKENDP